jgi:hypothetical protein
VTTASSDVAAAVVSAAPPPRPGRLEERLGLWLLGALAPPLRRVEQPPPPPALAPFEHGALPRPAAGPLAATWYPAGAAARGAVLLLPPWIEWGQAYFHRHGRVEALRQAGHHVLTVDFGGFGTSDRAPGFADRDVAAALAGLRARADGLPCHLWGVSAGGYWGHLHLSGGDGVAGAFFEDVSPHLIEWAARVTPALWPAYAVYRRLLPRAYRFLDVRRHAPFLRARAVAYASGELDVTIPPADTAEVARLAGAPCLLVPGATHLQAIKLAPDAVIGLALRTFAAA